MSWLQAVVLAVVQGASEFLPISSSGHLALVARLLGVGQLPLAFVVVVHLGTLLAVFAYYRQDFARMLKSLVIWKSADEAQHQRLAQSRRLVGLLAIGTLPAAIVGYLVEDAVQQLFGNILIVGLALIGTGLILVAANWLRGKKDQTETTVPDALIVGLAQALALVPGISRSGCTIAGGLARGLQRDWAPRFAFLLSAPVILGGSVLAALELAAEPPEPGMLACYLLGAAVAAASGYLAIRVVVGAVRAGNLVYFAGYCVVVGAVTIVATGF